MDALSSMASTIGSLGMTSDGGGSIWSKIIPLLGLGSGVMGTVGNIEANRTKNQILGTELGQMKTLQNMTPAQLVAQEQSLQQPLSQNLVNSVTNAVSGNLAARGLSQAPGIQAASIAQGLAPYQMQEQQMAQQALFQKLGLPISARPSPFQTLPGTTNMSQMWQSMLGPLSKLWAPGASTPQASPGTIANIGANLGWNPDIPQLDTLPINIGNLDNWSFIGNGIQPSYSGGS